MERAQEQALVVKAAAGDRHAASSLIQAHQASLYCYLLRVTGRRDIAEDVTQEAFYRALKSLDRYDPRWRFSTWLFTIARRVWLNARDRRGPSYNSDLLARTDDVRPVWGLHGWVEPASEEQALQRRALERAMAELTDLQREAVVLFHQMDWPIKVVSLVMDLPEGTVKSHLFRARARLREVLASSGSIGAEHVPDHRARGVQSEAAARGEATAQGEGLVQVPEDRTADKRSTEGALADGSDASPREARSDALANSRAERMHRRRGERP